MPNTILIVYNAGAESSVRHLVGELRRGGFDGAAIRSSYPDDHDTSITVLSELSAADMEEVKGIVAEWRIKFACAVGTGWMGKMGVSL